MQYLDHELSPFATSNIEAEREYFRNGLSKIVTKATRLDADLQKQRAIFSTWTPVHPERNLPYGYAPDPGVTESDEERPLDEQKLIELVVVPVLCKRGNADGDGYDKSIVLVKCRVTQDGPEEDLEKSGSPIPSPSNPPGQPPRGGAGSEDKGIPSDGKGRYRSLLRKRIPDSK